VKEKKSAKRRIPINITLLPALLLKAHTRRDIPPMGIDSNKGILKLPKTPIKDKINTEIDINQIHIHNFPFEVFFSFVSVSVLLSVCSITYSSI